MTDERGPDLTQKLLSEMRAQLEEARQERDKAEAVVTDVEPVLKSLIEWMHGLPDNVPGVARHEAMVRNLVLIADAAHASMVEDEEARNG